MTKNKFAGLAEAKMKALDSELKESDRQEEHLSVPKPKKVVVQKQASRKASNKTSKLENKQTSSEEDLVGVTILIPEGKRVWWNVQAKLQRTTLKNAIIEALDARFGEAKDL